MTYVKTVSGGWPKPFKHFDTNKSNYVTDLQDDNIPRTHHAKYDILLLYA